VTADPNRAAAAGTPPPTSTPAGTAPASLGRAPQPPTARAADVPPVVQASGVGKVFGTDRAAVTALEAVELTIQQGEFVSLIGPSGCGKSTLLRLIGDLTAPTTGTILVNGKPPSRARQDRDYGMVFQAPVLMDWRTIAKNIELPLEIMGFSGDERRRRSADLLRLVELEAFAERHPWELSGGMQQRVAIARALSFDPKLLLMDEPFGALDEMTRERMNAELMSIWRRTGTTIVFVTHSIPEAIFLSTRVVVMSARPGRISRVIDIDLPAERSVETRESARYFELVTRVREALRQHEPAEAELDAADAERIRAEGLG
jgi:NitT/TauT family transport system ATP-binding protein